MVGMGELGQEPTGGFVFVGTVVGEHLGQTSGELQWSCGTEGGLGLNHEDLL